MYFLDSALKDDSIAIASLFFRKKISIASSGMTLFLRRVKGTYSSANDIFVLVKNCAFCSRFI